MDIGRGGSGWWWATTTCLVQQLYYCALQKGRPLNFHNTLIRLLCPVKETNRDYLDIKISSARTIVHHYSFNNSEFNPTMVGSYFICEPPPPPPHHSLRIHF